MKWKHLTPIMFCGRPGSFRVTNTGDGDPALRTLMDHVTALTTLSSTVCSKDASGQPRLLSYEYVGGEPFRLVLTRNMELSAAGSGQAFFVSSTGMRHVYTAKMWVSDDTLFDGTVFEGHLVPLVAPDASPRDVAQTMWSFLVSDLLLIRGRHPPALLQGRLEEAQRALSDHHVPDDHDACIFRVQLCHVSTTDPEGPSWSLPDAVRVMAKAYPAVSAVCVRTAHGLRLTRVLSANAHETRMRTTSVVMPMMGRTPGTSGVSPHFAARAGASTARPPFSPSVKPRRELTLWALPTALPDVYELTETFPDATSPSGTVGKVHAYVPTLRVSEDMIRATARGPAHMRFYLHPVFSKWTPVEQ